jgi:hypothetical protein
MVSMLTETMTGQIAIVAIPSRAENMRDICNGEATKILINPPLATKMISSPPVIMSAAGQRQGESEGAPDKRRQGNARSAPPTHTEASTEAINTSIGSSVLLCKSRLLCWPDGSQNAGRISTPVENCSLNQSPNSIRKILVDDHPHRAKKRRKARRALPIPGSNQKVKGVDQLWRVAHKPLFALHQLRYGHDKTMLERLITTDDQPTKW